MFCSPGLVLYFQAQLCIERLHVAVWACNLVPIAVKPIPLLYLYSKTYRGNLSEKHDDQISSNDQNIFLKKWGGGGKVWKCCQEWPQFYDSQRWTACQSWQKLVNITLQSHTPAELHRLHHCRDKLVIM